MTPKQDKNSIVTDSFDRSTWKNVIGEAPRIKELCQAGLKTYQPFSDLMNDTFQSLYKYNPELTGVETIQKSHKLNHELIEKTLDSQQYKMLRASTKMDETLSAVSSMTIAKQFKKTLNDELFDATKAAHFCAKNHQKMEEFLEKAQFFEDTSKEVTNPAQAKKFEEMAKDAFEKVSMYADKEEELAKHLDMLLNGKETQKIIQKLVQCALGEAQKKVTEVNTMLEVWGSDAGNLQTMDIEQRLELAEQMVQNPKLKNIANMIGKFTRIINAAERKKVASEAGEIYDIELGDNLARVIPSEISLLCNDSTKLLFYRKYTEKNLIQYAIQDQENKGLGPMITLIDSSGSMAGARDEWSKAIGISLLHFAQSKQRDFIGIVFSGCEDTLLEFKFSKDERDIEKTINFATAFINGGTDFEHPLGRAITHIKTTPQFKEADIVLITDGFSQMSEYFLESLKKSKKELDFNIHTILINTHQDSVIKEFSNSIHHVDDLKGEGVLTIMESII